MLWFIVHKILSYKSLPCHPTFLNSPGPIMSQNHGVMAKLNPRQISDEIIAILPSTVSKIIALAKVDRIPQCEKKNLNNEGHSSAPNMFINTVVNNKINEIIVDVMSYFLCCLFLSVLLCVVVLCCVCCVVVLGLA